MADGSMETFQFWTECRLADGSYAGSWPQAITGSGAMAVISGVPEGRRCSSWNLEVDGFLPTQPQDFVIVAGETQVLTFTQRRTGSAASFRIWHSASGDANEQLFEFTATCTLDGAPVPRSPFKLSRMGTGYTLTVVGLADATRCKVVRDHIDGWVDVAPKVLIMKVGTTQVASFRAVRDNGLRAWVRAPADLQGWKFELQARCTLDGAPVTGSPFTLSRTGPGGTNRVWGVPAGARCVVAPSGQTAASFVRERSKTLIIRQGKLETATFSMRPLLTLCAVAADDADVGSLLRIRVTDGRGNEALVGVSAGEGPGGTCRSVARDWIVAPGNPYLSSVAGDPVLKPIRWTPEGANWGQLWDGSWWVRIRDADPVIIWFEVGGTH